jgi:hypothetical protein
MSQTKPRSAPEASEPTAEAARPTITRILTALPIALNGEVYTFVDMAKHEATMEHNSLGVLVTTKSKPSKQGRFFLVPWSNVLAVCYPPPAGVQRLDPYGKPMGQVGATS